MTRYIDGEKLLEYYEERYKNLCKRNVETDAYCQGYNDAMYAAEHIDFAADVVPKSEVDRLQAELDDFKVRSNATCKACGQTTSKAIEDLQNKLFNAKTEIAREIFEEIESIIRKHDERPKYQLMLDLAELKKKYTEGE